MKAQDVTQLTDKIRLEYGFTEEAAQDRAMKALENCPPALAQNVEEWTKGQKLTDIYISQYSLPMILAIWNSRDFLKALELPSSVYNMLPYIISLVVLAFTSKKSRAPKAEGIPYDKGSR